MSCQSVLGENGSLKSINPAFVARKGQLEMALAIEQTIKSRSQLVVEAGTGTGKTFAYLVPALLSGGKVIISTGTKTLQDQLFHKDLPAIKKVIAKPFRTALLKGRSNYLCQYRLKHHAPTALFTTKKAISDLSKITKWAGQTKKGDIAELHQVPEDSPVWSAVTSTNDNCLGSDCPLYDECHVVKARRWALKADVVVINHHLFFADASLKVEGFSELLPEADTVIFDEAHQLIDTATLFFSERLSSRQLSLFCRDAKNEHEKSVNDCAQLVSALDKVEWGVGKLRDALGPTGSKELWRTVASKPAVERSVALLNDYLSLALSLLSNLAERSPGLKHCHERGQVLLRGLTDLVAPQSERQFVHWFEVFRSNFTVYLTPISVAKAFTALLARDTKSWIFTSATLASNQDFHYFESQLGLDQPKRLIFESPFELSRQTLLYVPRGLPDIKQASLADKLVDACLPVIERNPGGTFFLFTSYATMHAVYDELKATDLTLWLQGTMSKRRLIEQFISHENSVLLGTASFWEGVDIPGKALSCVIIDKLPFASPGDPIVKARIEAMRSQGGDPFNTYQLPNAVINLKQGVGRLIRSVHDRGVLIICDLRLIGRQYGAVFLSTMAETPLTRDLDKVIAFYEQDNPARH